MPASLGAPVTWHELRDGHRGPTLQARWVLDKRDVQRRSRKQSCACERDQFERHWAFSLVNHNLSM
jgi:hypothetical protein